MSHRHVPSNAALAVLDDMCCGYTNPAGDHIDGYESCAEWDALRCRWICGVIPAKACEAICPDLATSSESSAFKKFRAAFHKSCRSRYLLPNIMYLFYAAGILYIDYFQYFGYTLTEANDMFLGWGAVHFISAILYAWSWYGRRWNEIVLFPEYLNIIGAILYLVSASMYQYGDPSVYPYTAAEANMKIHYLEATASGIEVCAAFGW
jgi:hypothetical protein